MKNAIWHTEKKMNYEQAMAFLEDTKKYGSRMGLTGIKNLMRELGNVQEQIPIVHIAGTNGKGSVGAMLSSVLAEAGYQVGRFDTPDVFSYEEEFLMNGKPIEKHRLAQIFTRAAEACAKMTASGMPHPTRFEVETAAAFLWFYEEKCDLALVEVGMGGETDATNLVSKPLVSILTPISMDHMKFLGNTLAEIAKVKSGVIKPGCPVVSMIQRPEAMNVIVKKCEQLHAPLIQADASMAQHIICSEGKVSFVWDVGSEVCNAKEEMHTEENTLLEDGESKIYNGEQRLIKISLGLRGHFQIENAICVLRVLELLQQKYPKISEKAIQDGLEKVRWPGRFEQILSGPDVFLDGAHNEDAVRKLRTALDDSFPGKRIIYIMGVLADKEYDKMIRIMFQEGDKVFTVTPPNLRALPAEELAYQLKRQNIDAIYCEKPEDAVLYALDEANAEDIILAFGSLYYLNGVRKAFLKEFRITGNT